MAFVSRKANSFYLAHNFQRRGKVRQLHLAGLGERARLSESPVMAEEIRLQLRPLHSIIQVTLNPFDQGRVHFSDNLSWDSRFAGRRP
jgi:hypothetical protein